MGTAKQTIEINGRAYDAETGQLLSEENTQPAAKSVAPKPVAKQSNSGQVLDGFVRRANSSSTTIESTNGATAGNHVSRNLQKSQTLMRPAVKKPVHTPHKVDAKKPTKPELNVQSSARIERAGAIAKSGHISRFGRTSHKTHAIVKKSAALPVASKPHLSDKVEPVVEKFEKAMHDATAHLETFVPAARKKSRKLLYSSASIVAVLVLGLAAYQFVPEVKVRLAGTKAGFSASLPNYSPAGFGLGNQVAANSGEVTLTYQSRTDDKNYKITQNPSNWTSQSLLNNFVIPANKPYQTYEDSGKTVYIYDNSNATWVDGGIWYRLEGNASLTSDQLLRIANSL